MEPITTLEDVPEASAGGRWQTHPMTAHEIYMVHVFWPGLIIQSNAGQDPSLLRALNGSSTVDSRLTSFLIFPFIYFLLGG